MHAREVALAALIIHPHSPEEGGKYVFVPLID